MIRQLSGGLLIGLMATVFAISFASIIYSGDLSQYLVRGIGITLVGAAVMAAVGTVTFTFRGSVMHPQDVTAILLAGGAASVVAAGQGLPGDALFATVVVLVALSTAIAGLACVVLGHLRLSFIARFLPYPVLGGFLAATGYFLVLGGIGVALESTVTLWTFTAALDPVSLVHWVPWVLAGLLVAAIAEVAEGDLVLPGCFAASCAIFYAVLAVTGTPLEAAMQHDWLLGPFPESGFLADIDASMLAQVQWSLILTQIPLILAVTAMTVLGGLLNVTGINHLVGNDGDLDTDLRAIGYANLASAGLGGMVGYPALGESTLGHRLGLIGATAGICVVVLNLAAAVFGAATLALLPKGLFAMVLVYLGADLLYDWLWKERHRLPRRDFLIVLGILAVAATVGFLPALAAGILVSVTMFIVSYARLEFIRVQTTLANRPSMVERADPERSFLRDAGGNVPVLELTGVLFFGTATMLRERVLGIIRALPVRPPALVVDFRRVRDVDVSAMRSLERTLLDLEQMGVDVHVSGFRKRLARRLLTFPQPEIRAYPTLDTALQAVEAHLLSRMPATKGPADTQTFLQSLAAAHPALHLTRHFRTQQLSDGDVLIAEGQASDEIFVLLEGSAHAVVDREGAALVVSRFLPGALIGEMAYYRGAPRSASVVADGPARVLRIEAHQLGPDSDLPPELVSSFHRLAAGFLSQRLDRTNRLLHDAEL